MQELNTAHKNLVKTKNDNCSYDGTQWNKVWWLVVKHC